jgi:hypothetical protein
MKRAILVAMADEYPFKEIHESLHSELEGLYKKYGFDVFYVYARKSSKLEKSIRRAIEEIRWGKFYLLLRIYDLLILSRFKYFIPNCTVQGKYIRVNVPEDLRHLSIKILSSLEVIKNLEYDLVIRTTASSILNPRLISIQCSRIASLSNIYYGGKEIRQMDGFRFISGSFTILNRKAMNLLLNSRRRLDFSLIDDVCFGRLFKSNEISTEDLASINVEEVSSVPSLESIHETFHFRCKSGTVNRNDLAVMQHLMRQIKKNELNS